MALALGARAVMIGRPARLAARISRFWAAGTRSMGISTPRSPRATMMASEASRISSSAMIASVVIEAAEAEDA